MLKCWVKAVYNRCVTFVQTIQLFDLLKTIKNAWVQIVGLYHLCNKVVRPVIHSNLAIFLSVNEQVIRITHRTNNNNNELYKGVLL